MTGRCAASQRCSPPIRFIADIIGWTVRCIALPLLDVDRVALFDVLDRAALFDVLDRAALFDVLDRAALFNVLLALHRPLLSPTLAMTTSGGPLAKGGASVSMMGLCMYMFMCMRGATVELLAKSGCFSRLSRAYLITAGVATLAKGVMFGMPAKGERLAKSCRRDG